MCFILEKNRSTVEEKREIEKYVMRNGQREREEKGCCQRLAELMSCNGVTDETSEGKNRSRSGVEMKWGNDYGRRAKGGGKSRVRWWERARGHVEATRTTKYGSK